MRLLVGLPLLELLLQCLELKSLLFEL